MRMPGFNAEASLYNRSGLYELGSAQMITTGGTVFPADLTTLDPNKIPSGQKICLSYPICDEWWNVMGPTGPTKGPCKSYHLVNSGKCYTTV
jgi:hypothetical protein